MRSVYNIQDVPLDSLKDNPYDQRKQYGDIEGLANSIEKRGLKYPITVVKSDNDFIIVHGHRRAHAFRYLKRKKIPAIIQKESNPSDLMIDLAVENFQRKDLTPAEKATTIEMLFYEIPSVKKIENVIALINQVKMIRDGKEDVGGGFSIDDIITAEDFIELLGMSPNTAIMYLRILFLPEEIQQNVVSANSAKSIPEGKMGIKAGYELTRIKDADLQKELAEKVVKDKIKHMELKHIIDNIIDHDNKIGRKSVSGSPERRLEDDVGMAQLTEQLFLLSAKVENYRIKIPRARGRLDEIEFDAALEKMKKSCMNLIKTINEFLIDNLRMEDLLEYVNADLNVVVNEDFRFTFPCKMAEILGIKEGDVLLLKVEGVKKKSVELVHEN